MSRKGRDMEIQTNGSSESKITIVEMAEYAVSTVIRLRPADFSCKVPIKIGAAFTESLSPCGNVGGTDNGLSQELKGKAQLLAR